MDSIFDKPLMLVGCVVGLAFGVASLLAWAETPDEGPRHAEEWAARFAAEGPVYCVRDAGKLYRCTIQKSGRVVALECWDRGCAMQRCEP